MKNYKELLDANLDWAKETFNKIDRKMSKVCVRSRDIIADGVDGNGRHIERNPTNWTSGFWGGLNYMLYAYTKNPDYLACGESIEKQMDAGLAQFMELHHDVGFMWHILSGAHYKLTGDEKSKTRNLYAASTLFSRFIIDGGYIRAWNDYRPEDQQETNNWTIIDSMMNIPLLYWASRELKDDRFKRVAMAQADMALMDHVRDDGSVIHEVEHNRETGEPVKDFAGQGYEVGSSWSRGQAWALYGYIISYIHTNEERYLNCAKRVANYFIANCCDDWLPRVDFRAPSEPVYYDSTAGAIAACGLIEIAKAVGENEGGMYMNAAINILRAMGDKFMDWSDDTDCMLKFGTVRYPVDGLTLEKAGVHISIIYGDYFYTEAILKLLGAEFFPW